MGNQVSGHGDGIQVEEATGRRPNDSEMLILLKLQSKLYTRLVQSPQHLELLRRYWNAICSSGHRKDQIKSFSRTGAQWQLDGGCCSANPGDDLRAMGQLGLECLVFFCENFQAESHLMKRKQGGYPFVKTCMALVRALCEVFALVDDQSSAKGAFPVQKAMFWQLLTDEMAFFQLFSLCLLRFEQEFCDNVAQDPALLRSASLVISIDLDSVHAAPAASISYCSLAVVSAIVDHGKAQLLEFFAQAPNSLEDLARFCCNSPQVLNKRQFIKPFACVHAWTRCESSWSSKRKPLSQCRDKVQQILRDWERPEQEEQQKRQGQEQEQEQEHEHEHEQEQELEREPAPLGSGDHVQKSPQNQQEHDHQTTQNLFQGLHVY